MELESADFSYSWNQNQIIVRPGMRRYLQFSSRLKELYIRKFLTQPLKVLYDSHVCIQEIEFTCLSLNIPGANASVYITGSISLATIDFSENLLTFLDPRIFQTFNAVVDLILSQNSLGDAFAEEGNVRSIITNLKNLKKLIVSGNGLYTLPYDSFENAHLLQILDLSNNNLEAVTFSTEGLTALEHLDLRNNKITVVDPSSLQRINSLIIQNVHITSNCTVSTSIGLQGNPISCSCENRHYFNWTIAYNMTATCLMDGDIRVIGQRILGLSYYLCKENIVIVTYSLLATLEVVAVVVLVFTVLRIIKDAQVEAKIKRGIQQYKENNENRQNIPVFLSFCCEDDDIVMNDIAPKLDEGLKNLLKTDSRCVATGYNDFRPGKSLANEIIRCVEESSVVVFFVTKAFCKKMWCRNEALIAYYEQKPTVLMIWEEVNLKLMPKYLYHQYQHNTRVHWVRENGERVMKPGWDKFCESIVGLFAETME